MCEYGFSQAGQGLETQTSKRLSSADSLKQMQGGGAAVTGSGASIEIPPPARVSVLTILIQVVKNPIVNLTFLGVVWNLVFKGRMPSFLYDLLNSFGSLFPVLAIFLIGINIYGTVSLKDWDTISTYVFIVLAKMMILPVFNYFFTMLLGGSSDLATYAFIVGALPVAPTLSIYALRYTTPSKNYVSSLSAAIVLSTVLGVPLLLVMVVGTMVMDQTADPIAIQAIINLVVYNLTIAAVVGVSWVVISFTVAKRTFRSSYGLIYAIVIITLIRSLLVLLANGTNKGPATANINSAQKLQVVVTLFFSFSHRIWIVLISLFSWVGRRFGLDRAQKLQGKLSLAGFLIAVLLTVVATILLLSRAAVSGLYLCTPSQYHALTLLQLVFLLPCIAICCAVALSSRRALARDMRVASIATAPISSGANSPRSRLSVEGPSATRKASSAKASTDLRARAGSVRNNRYEL